jgi:hypothetical protein
MDKQRKIDTLMGFIVGWIAALFVVVIVEAIKHG